MPNSMTGFGRGEGRAGGSTATAEVRSVNNRYLNVRLRVPARYQRFEATLEEQVRRELQRGTVDVTVRVQGDGAAQVPRINEGLALSYVASLESLAKKASLGGAIDLHSLLLLPGVVVLEDQAEAEDEVLEAAASALKKALAGVAASREAEGRRLQAELSRLLDRAERAVKAIARRAKGVPAALQKRLHERVLKLLDGAGPSRGRLDPGQLEREVALLADRADITEELARFSAHVAAFREQLLAKGAVGRQLDFLTQELGREANTIGAKNQDVVIARHAVELKSWVERIREQVQNIE